MSFLNKTVSFLAILACVPAAYAVTSRVGISTTTSSRRLPTLSAAGTVVNYGANNTVSAKNLLDESECITAYEECIAADDACGSDFSECTTTELFHAQMPKCTSALFQCQSGGVSALFGTSSVLNLNEITNGNQVNPLTKKNYQSGDDGAMYKYPAVNSVMGARVAAAAIANRLNTQDCVKKYSNCLHKESVCGSDFELCTDKKSFRKQALACQSTFERCGAEGRAELLGDGVSSLTSIKDSTTIGGRVAEMITEGASLAAMNAVSTCYKTVEQCVLNACKKNPLKCSKDASASLTSIVEGIVAGRADVATITDGYKKLSVESYLRSECGENIGQNKYCYITVHGKTPTESQLRDEDNEVFDDLYSSRVSDAAMQSKIKDLIDAFDRDTKTACVDTVKQCAMRSCGGGNGAVCYKKVFGTTNGSNSGTNALAKGLASKGGTKQSIFNQKDDIEHGCAAIVNNSPSCIYAAMNSGAYASGTYDYNFYDGGAFEGLFSADDPIGVIAQLDAALTTSYNDAAIEAKRKQCQGVVRNCVTSMCGADFAGCYRNRTDIVSDTYNTGNGKFDLSMNKVNGVLDYTIVIGLCSNTVRNSDVCSDTLAIAQANYTTNAANTQTAAWGHAVNNGATVTTEWLDAAGNISLTNKGSLDDEKYPQTDADGNALCQASVNKDKCGIGICGAQVPLGKSTTKSVAITCNYDDPMYTSLDNYAMTRAENDLFQEQLMLLEKEAQAQYNQKLTLEQNACLAMNKGGVMGKNDMGSTYQWSKLKSRKVPDDYTINGLGADATVPSNDLYGSFCRVRVTLHSDDPRLQAVLSGKGYDYTINDQNKAWSKDEKRSKHVNGYTQYNTAYFAIGDAVTCGSWLPESVLSELARAVAQNETAEMAKKQERNAALLTTAMTLVGGAGGAVFGDQVGKGNIMGGLTGITSTKKTKANLLNKLDALKTGVSGIKASTAASTALSTTNSSLASLNTTAGNLIQEADKLGATDDYGLKNAMQALNAHSSSSSSSFDENTERDEVAKLKNTATTAIQSLRNDVDNISEKMSEDQKKNHATATAVSSILGAAGAGALTYGITRGVQKNKLSEAEQAAYDEFMSTVGNSIHCYVGTEEAGVYGETVTLEYDE